MGLMNTAKQTFNNAKGSGESVVDAFKNFSFKNLKWGSDLPVKPPGALERGFIGTLKWTVGKPLQLGLKTIDWTAGVLAKPVAWVAAAPGAVFRTFPTAAPIVTVLGGVIGIGSWITHRRSAAMMNQYAQAQEAAIQAAAAQEAMASQAQGPVSYKNSASQAEVDARIAQDRADGKAPASHAANVEAAKAQPAQGMTSVA